MPEKITYEVDPTFGENFSIEIVENQQGEVLVNINSTLLMDVPPGAKLRICLFETKDFVTFKAYGRPLEYNICYFMKTDTLLYPYFQAKSNYPKKCPMKAGEYYLLNYIVPTNKLPPIIVHTKLKITVEVYENNKNFVKVTCLGRIDSKDNVTKSLLHKF